MIGTTLNSFNSMFFMIIITRINGTEDAGLYTLVFQSSAYYIILVFMQEEHSKLQIKQIDIMILNM